MIFQGIRTSIAKEPFSFVIFQQGSPDSLGSRTCIAFRYGAVGWSVFVALFRHTHMLP